MTIYEWKLKLRPAGLLLIWYFAAPLVTGWILGGHGAIYGGFTVSNILQAGLGGACLYKLFGLKELLGGELTARLGKFGQPQEKVLEISGRILAAAGFICVAGLMLPPLGGMFPDSRLMTLVKLATAGYIVYLASVIWKLYAPFLAHVHPDLPVEVPVEPPAAPVRRCVKCGQKIDDSMKACAFCRQPIG